MKKGKKGRKGKKGKKGEKLPPIYYLLNGGTAGTTTVDKDLFKIICYVYRQQHGLKLDEAKMDAAFK